MFAKVKDRLDASVKSQRPTGSGGTAGRIMPSIVGPDMTVSGNLTTPGEVHVEGRVDGDVTCARLTIGASGAIHGKVRAGSVRVHGKVDGAIDAEEVYLLAGSEVLGDIMQGTLEIAPGAMFEGAVRRRTESRPVAALEPPPPVEQEGHFEPVEEPAPTTSTEGKDAGNSGNEQGDPDKKAQAGEPSPPVKIEGEAAKGATADSEKAEEKPGADASRKDKPKAA